MHLSEYEIVQFLNEVRESSIEIYKKRKGHLIKTEVEQLKIAIFYQRRFCDTQNPKYYNKALTHFEAAKKAQPHHYFNQVQFELGLLYLANNKKYLAIQAFQAVDINQCEQPDLPLYYASRREIKKAFLLALPVTDNMTFKSRQMIMQNDVKQMVAMIDLVRHGEREGNNIHHLSRFIDMNAMFTRNELVFINNALSLQQVYKIARLCKDRRLINARNYLDILSQLEQTVQYADAPSDVHMRKKIRFQLMLTLIDEYHHGEVAMPALRELFERFMRNEASYRLALAAGDKKALAMQRLMLELHQKGREPVYRQQRILTPISNPIDHYLAIYSGISTVTRPICKWPLYVIGTILDVVLVFPMIFKLLTAVWGISLSKQGRNQVNWSGSWFTGLLGTVVGDWILGCGIAASMSLALTVVTYPFRFAGNIARRVYESLGGRENPENQHRAAWVNERVIATALKAGVNVPRKPMQHYASEKNYKHYKTPESYVRVYQFMNQNFMQDNRPSAPPAQLIGVNNQEILQGSSNAGMFAKPQDYEQSIYLEPPRPGIVI